MVNFAADVFPLVSVAEQVTTVRPIRKRVPDRGLHDTGTAPSTSSRALTAKVTGTRLASRGARTVLPTAPLSDGAVTSNSSPGTTSVPFHVSLPRPPPTERSTVPLPDAPS